MSQQGAENNLRNSENQQKPSSLVPTVEKKLKWSKIVRSPWSDDPSK